MDMRKLTANIYVPPKGNIDLPELPAPHVPIGSDSHTFVKVVIALCVLGMFFFVIVVTTQPSRYRYSSDVITPSSYTPSYTLPNTRGNSGRCDTTNKRIALGAVEAWDGTNEAAWVLTLPPRQRDALEACGL